MSVAVQPFVGWVSTSPALAGIRETSTRGTSMRVEFTINLERAILLAAQDPNVELGFQPRANSRTRDVVAGEIC